jgi:AcrR family transcriptional regulator
MNKRKHRSYACPRKTRKLLTPSDWILAGQRLLIASGVAGVKIDRLARRLGVTRGSFYWHFKSHADLLRDLIKLWEDTNTAPFFRVVSADNRATAVEKFRTIIDIWVEEKDYSSAFDTAVRDWARSSRTVAECVRRIDATRIDILMRVFKELGYGDREALVRARITYFHYVGANALKIEEPKEYRMALVPIVRDVLMGHPHSSVDGAS